MTDLTPIQVVASADDAHSWGTTYPGYGTSSSITGTNLYLGANASYFYCVGARFLNVSIPKGATITGASISFRRTATSSTTQCDVLVYGEDVDDSAAFANSSNPTTGLPGYRVGTTEKVRWNIGTESWAANSWHDSPDIAAVIQEISDRANRNETFDLSILVANYAQTLPAADNTRYTCSYDLTGNVSGPILNVSYTVPGGMGIFHNHFQGQGMI